MVRAGIVLGLAVDAVLVAALLAVSGPVASSWTLQPANIAGVTTGAWLIALVVCAAAPALAYGLHRRNAPRRRIILILWLPALILATLVVAALVVSPPR